jgi:peptidoglycan/xylan/chitin deacetylase (PgdA/CDA1 family)
MRWIKKRHRVVGPDATLTPLPGPAVLVTLDDGYADNYHEALPVLRAEGIRALIFLVAGYAGTDNLLQHDEGGPVETNRLLRWEEVRDCDSRYVEFGSHGWSHRRLSTIADDVQMAQEVFLSKQRIEEESGRPVRFFSFPFGVEGDYDARATGMVREAGYQAAFNAKYGENREGVDAFDLYRIGVERSDNLFTLRAKLNGALDLLRWAQTPWGRRCVRWMNRAVGA